MSELQERVQAAVGSGYRVERELGGGGMSRVYLTTEVALGRSVVIKLLAPELTSDVLAARFRREFQVTAVLGQHPHILPVLSTGTNGGLLYFITPYIEGESLRHRLRREGRLPVEDAVRILTELGSALAFAHEKGIVHRDLKPENVLLSDGHAVLADFGISAVLARPATPPPGGDDARLTEGGIAVGTPGYMSPEQAAGDADIDGRSDLYSLAIIGYEMLTGAPPFTGDSPMAVMSAHLNEPPKPVRGLRADTPRGVADALGKALAKRPADRFQGAGAFCDALATSLSGGRAAAPVPARRRLALVLGVATLATLAGVAFLRRERPEAPNANLVAIAPFEALGTDLGVWREGLVDLLTSNLDGAGPLRVVPPSVVLRRAPARMDRTGARQLAERTRAGITIYGSLIASGRDSVRVTATIVETATGRATDVQWRDETARMDRLADSLSMAILRELGRTRAIGATRLASLGSSSLPALKAYLQGEQSYRRSDWDSAASHYQRAVALDSTFAPALRHLSNALGWRLTPQLELSNEGYRYALQAGALNRGLAPASRSSSPPTRSSPRCNCRIPGNPCPPAPPWCAASPHSSTTGCAAFPTTRRCGSSSATCTITSPASSFPRRARCERPAMPSSAPSPSTRPSPRPTSTTSNSPRTTKTWRPCAGRHARTSPSVRTTCTGAACASCSNSWTRAHGRLPPVTPSSRAPAPRSCSRPSPCSSRSWTRPKRRFPCRARCTRHLVPVVPPPTWRARRARPTPPRCCCAVMWHRRWR
ncbi:MAG: protein kinase [Gemmatimonadetes bacterium]|nr:protein kinase [Gemmatimonadota bacterium]